MSGALNQSGLTNEFNSNAKREAEMYRKLLVLDYVAILVPLIARRYAYRAQFEREKQATRKFK